MRMYKIIPKERRITEITYDGTYSEMRRYLPYEYLGGMRVNKEGDYLFINDIGFLEGPVKKDGIFYIWRSNGGWQPISGLALYWGTTKTGENANPSITLEQLENLIQWKGSKEMHARS